MQLFLYSGKKALPVYFNSKTPVFDVVDPSLITYDKKKKVMRVNELGKGEREGKENEGFDATSYQLQGIINEFTIMMWFAECCPASVTEKSRIERKSAVEIKGGRRRSSFAPNALGDRRSSALGSQGRSNLLFAMPQLGGGVDAPRSTAPLAVSGATWESSSQEPRFKVF